MTEAFGRQSALMALLLAAVLPGCADAANACSVDVASIGFGGVDVLTGLPVDSVGGPIVVSCTGDSGTVNLSIGLDAGAGSGATEATRWMRLTGSSTDQLAYSLFSSSSNRASHVYWGNSGSSLYNPSITVSNDSGSGSFSVYGEVFGGQQTAKSGMYTDTLTITVSY
jgi:spore coat protein U-like protein